MTLEEIKKHIIELKNQKQNLTYDYKIKLREIDREIERLEMERSQTYLNDVNNKFEKYFDCNNVMYNEEILCKCLELRNGKKLTDFETFIRKEWLKYKNSKYIITSLRRFIFGDEYMNEYILIPEMVISFCIENDKFKPLVRKFNGITIGMTDDNIELLKKIILDYFCENDNEA